MLQIQEFWNFSALQGSWGGQSDVQLYKVSMAADGLGMYGSWFVVHLTLGTTFKQPLKVFMTKVEVCA